MNTKFGMNVSNKILLNAAKSQGYSFWVIKRKPTWRGGNFTPPAPPTQIRVNAQNGFHIWQFLSVIIHTEWNATMRGAYSE